MTKRHEIVTIDGSDEEKERHEEENPVTKWIEFKKERLTMQGRQVISKGKWLVDKHVSFAQIFIQEKFKTFNSLKCTQYETKQLTHLENMLQIIHIGSNHWAIIFTIGSTEETVKLYDSLYTSIGSETITIIASLFRFPTPSFTVEVMNEGRQVGFQDCGLYAISFVTSLAYGEDPTIIKYEDQEMRNHLLECFEIKELSPFPSKKR
uniref:Ubiquitin-like protease family profile domain-containing protein n=1 Tax=Amphimedon queenslandica TaxID=400682 RepID=A0A1X7VA30_AMPQE